MCVLERITVSVHCKNIYFEHDNMITILFEATEKLKINNKQFVKWILSFDWTRLGTRQALQYFVTIEIL